jgi:hypothetical protein
MNQLSNTIVDLGLYRRARTVRARTAPDGRRQRSGLLTCRWRRDPATGRLLCAWTTQNGAREAQPPLRRSLTN